MTRDTSGYWIHGSGVQAYSLWQGMVKCTKEKCILSDIVMGLEALPSVGIERQVEDVYF
jgi:hypothetical protein